LSGQRLYREAIERENIKGGGFSFYVWRGRFEGGEQGGGRFRAKKAILLKRGMLYIMIIKGKGNFFFKR
jgi:hypothetical protein